MVKFYGVIGYGETVETPTGGGVYKDVITEKSYYGDVIRNSRHLQQGENLNKDLSVQNSISIVADAYANQNFMTIRYVAWLGSLWTVTDVEVQAPRLILRLGGVYNGPTSAAP